MKRSKTFTVTYNYFEPGTYVTPASQRSVLSHGDGSLLFKVTQCLEPNFPEDTCIVFVKGHRYGVGTEYLRAATSEELIKGERLGVLL